MNESPLDAPEAEYRRRLETHRARRDRARREDLIYSGTRLGVFVAGLTLALLVVSSDSVPVWTLGAPALVFAALIVLHTRCRRRMEQAGRRATYYEESLARLGGEWDRVRGHARDWTPEGHLYADDLDLFGDGSLFRLICAAGTGVGRRRLAEWLAATADRETVLLRQAAVRELTPQLDLREDLALTALDVDPSLDPDALRKWAEAPNVLGRSGPRFAAAGLSVATGIALALWAAGISGAGPFALTMLAQIAFSWRLRDAVTAVLGPAGEAAAELRVLGRLLARLERESFECEGLRRLREEIEVEGHPPSYQVARLARRVDWVDQLRHNQLLYPVSLIFMGVIQGAMAIEAWRAHVGPSIGRWLDAVGDFEALASLARFAGEHPDYPFPEVLEGAARFEGVGIGHPLLPAANRVRNDVTLGEDRRLMLVSGSNMSGKSTLLRTVGVNAVLALAGAPVCAKSLRISPLTLGASIRVQDSLLEGSSRFYAEISRIKAIVSRASGTPPLLFLLDEIFGGTNSQDRRIGAAAVIRTLVERGAVGLVTTHDLALASIAEELGPRAANVHFEDDFRDGKIHFDYRLRPGLLTRGNALALMRSIGLEV
jgi:hypothetical protein